MKNRPRPHIPLDVKIQVASRQFSAMMPGAISLATGHSPLERVHENKTRFLRRILDLIALLLGSGVGASLHLDHDPPLRVRAYNPRIKNVAARYTPNANSPDHLIYLTEEAHRFKTNIKGEGAEHPDRVLIKKQRRLERGPKSKKSALRSRNTFKDRTGPSRWPKRGLAKRQKSNHKDWGK